MKSNAAKETVDICFTFTFSSSLENISLNNTEYLAKLLPHASEDELPTLAEVQTLNPKP